MNFGEIRGTLDKIITLLKRIDSHTNESGCCTATTSAGTNTSIPIGFSSISIVQTSAGLVNITMSDGSIFTLEITGEVFVDAAGANKSLPAYPISGSANWKWHGIK